MFWDYGCQNTGCLDLPGHEPLELLRNGSAPITPTSEVGPAVRLHVRRHADAPYNSTYIIKEPGAAAHVAWHQDLTYWGLSDPDAQVSMWLALAPATPASGCMLMLPGSHHDGQLDHAKVSGDDNLLLQGQRIEGLDTSVARPTPIEPGEASFHHGWTVHSSQPNVSADRRIGLNVQYLAPHNASASAVTQSAMLVRGTDGHGHWAEDTPARRDLDPDAVADWRRLEEEMKAGFQTG